MVLSKKSVERVIGSIGRRDYKNPTIQRSAKRALERKKTTKAPSKSRPSRSALKVGIPMRTIRTKRPSKTITGVIYPKVRTPPVKSVKEPLLHKQSVESLIGSIGRRDYRDPEIQRLAKSILRDKRIRKTPIKPIPTKKKVKTGGAIKYIYPTIQKVTTMKRRGKIMLSKKGVEKAIGLIGRRDYRDFTIQKIAKEAWDKKRAKILQN